MGKYVKFPPTIFPRCIVLLYLFEWILPVWQFCPVNPWTHWQEYLPIPSLQVPPFWQRIPKQSLISGGKNSHYDRNGNIIMRKQDTWHKWVLIGWRKSSFRQGCAELQWMIERASHSRLRAYTPMRDLSAPGYKLFKWRVATPRVKCFQSPSHT